MNMIPESNGFQKVKIKRNLSKKKIFKYINIILLILLTIGFVYQSISNFIGNEKIEFSLYYSKIENTKIEYNLKGSGDYTIVFLNDIGTNLNMWDSIIEKLNRDYNIRTFVYNRNGYGFSDIKENRSIKEEAQDLKILLRKAGVGNDIILIGEGYGSLIATAFSDMFSDSVQSVMLIDPIAEADIKSNEYKETIKKDYYKSIFYKMGSYVGITTFLDYLGKTYEVKQMKEVLTDNKKEEYQIQKTKRNFRQAVQMDFGNLYHYEGDFQKPGMFKEKPFYLITRNENEPLINLGSKDLTYKYITTNENKIISLSDEKSVIDGVEIIVKELNRKNKINS